MNKARAEQSESPEPGSATPEGDQPDGAGAGSDAWRARVQVLFEQIISQEGADSEPMARARRLAELSGGDARLAAEVDALLVAFDRARSGAWLESPAAVSQDQAKAALNELSGAGFTLPPMPARVGRFHIRRLIGTGGMGAVYEALQEQPHRVVAVKLMRHAAAGQRSLHRFQQEAELLARLRHPNIAQVFEAGVHQDLPLRAGVADGAAAHAARVPYIALELVAEGRPIIRYADEERLDTPSRLRLFAQVCDAAHHAHEQGIVHLDLKPSNILVGRDGQPKVIDFGVARAIDPEATRTGTYSGPAPLIGTLQYMSPEQVRLGERADLDRRVDVYALGLILYELLCGRLPYDLTSVTIAEATRRIQEQSPETPSRIVAGVRGDLETVVLTALRKEPSARYQTAAALRDDVLAVLEGRPILARRQTGAAKARRRAGRWVARHPVLSSVLAVIAAALLTSVAGEWIERRWTLPDLLFERAIGVNAAPTDAPPLDGVQLIRLSDDAPVEQIAVDAGLEGVTSGERASGRRLHGLLLERLAAANAKAVVMDLAFPGRSPYDADLIRGIRAVRASGKRVVAGRVQLWKDVPADEASDCPEIRRELPLTASSAMAHTAKRISVDLAARRVNGSIVVSPALAGWAAARHPEAEPLYSIVDAANEVRIEYVVVSETDRSVRRLPDIDRFVISSVEAEPPLDQGEDADEDRCGLHPGDVVASLFLDMPDPDVIDAASTPYADALSMPLEQLRRRVENRVVIVGDARAASGDFIGPDGSIPGSSAVAVSLAALQSGRYNRMPAENAGWGSMLLVATLGVALPLAAVRRLRRHAWVVPAVLLVPAAMVVIGACFYVTRVSGSVFYPFHLLLSLLFGFLLSVGVTAVRRAHRLEWTVHPTS